MTQHNLDCPVISGMGAVCSLGYGVPVLWEGLIAGRCGIRPLARLRAQGHRITHGGEVPPLPGTGAPTKDVDLAVAYILRAAEEALAQAGIHGEARRGVALVLGSNFGAMASTEQFMADPIGGGALGAGPLFGAPLSVARKELGLGGVGAAVSLSCASGNAAIGYALDLLRTGQAEAALAVGYDAISEIVWAGLGALHAMTAGALLPFDSRRSGTIFSEGAGAVLLETLPHIRGRGAAPLAQVAGYGVSCNAFHMTHPDPGGEGMVRAMKAALCDAGVAPEEIGHINAHATGTIPNDKLETAAIKAVFGEHARRIAVNGIKSMIGHAMGAASALEAIATVMTLREGIVPPTIGLEEPDPECDLDCTALKAGHRDVRVALNNAAGFGGCNAAVIFRRWEDEA